MPSPITTHVLDTSAGRPAEGVPVLLEISLGGNEWKELGLGVTNSDGRLANLLPDDHRLTPGIYRITFGIQAYNEHHEKPPGFYPLVPVIFEIPDPPDAHYHVPLLLNPYGYATYRGS